MSDIQAAGTIILFFALRCIAPLVVTVGIGYLMNRLVARWEAEETAVKEQIKSGVMKTAREVFEFCYINVTGTRKGIWHEQDES